MLDYTQRAKKRLAVKLSDEIAVTIGAPKKKLFSKLGGHEKTLKATTDIEPLYDEILRVTADILSNNAEHRVFTVDEVDELMDMEDMALLIREFSAFAKGLTNDPN